MDRNDHRISRNQTPQLGASPYDPYMTSPESDASEATQLTKQRLEACWELLRSVKSWIGDVTPSQDAQWLIQRQIELFVRAIQTMDGIILIASKQLWIPTYALARMLLEDSAVAHWLAVHPDLEALKARWSEHLDAAVFGDLKAQQELNLDIDPNTIIWHASKDQRYLDSVAHRHRDGTRHWTGKSITELIRGSAAQGAPGRNNWPERTHQLSTANRRMQLIVNLGVHHSPAASQNWYAPPSEMLPDGLRVAWLVFGLHAAVAMEDLVPARFGELRELLERQAAHFWMEPPAA
jgi:hypothetical protein